jgi:hypothetical protein
MSSFIKIEKMIIGNKIESILQNYMLQVQLLSSSNFNVFCFHSKEILITENDEQKIEREVVKE